MSTAGREGASRTATAGPEESERTVGDASGAAPTVHAPADGTRAPLLSSVPNQRGASAAESIVTGPDLRRRVVAVAAALAVVASGVAFGGSALARARHDGASTDQQVEAGRLAADTAARAQAEDSARTAIAHARVTLASATHAGLGPVAALEASIGSTGALLDDATSGATALTAATSLVVAGDATLASADAAASHAAQAAADQAAAAAVKVAAQKAAAQKAAAQKAASKAAAKKAAAAKAAAHKSTARPGTSTSTHSTTSTTTKSTATKSTATKSTATKSTTKATTKTATSTSSSATAALSHVPSGGLTCTSRGSGAHTASASSLGAAINAYRAKLGLKKLKIVTSSSLVNHALQMANTGGIWHSGHDNIVGCVSNASYSYLVQAWDASPPHRAQMRRTGISTMYIGDAERGSWLYGAVYFS